MGVTEIICLCGIGWLAATLGAIAGGNSLLTVPAMVLFGMAPQSAVATNMFAITFLCVGACYRFSRSEHLVLHPTLALAALAIPGSLLGAHVALSIPASALRTIVGISMLGIVALLLLAPSFGQGTRAISPTRKAVGYTLAAIWAVYGGLFSGGYTTVLTIGAVALFGTSLIQSVALTKFVNLASSAAATVMFAWRDAIDFRLGIPLALAMLIGGYTGAHLAARGGTKWIRKAMVAIVGFLAAVLLVREAVM